MQYTPLADPFIIHFQKDEQSYEVRVVYAKSKTSCANFFDIVVTRPGGIEPFCLKERPILDSDPDTVAWVDDNGKQSVLYQLIGEEIAAYLKNNLGIVLLDSQVREEESELNQ